MLQETARAWASNKEISKHEIQQPSSFFPVYAAIFDINVTVTIMSLRKLSL
jgi:hypothetical protein